MTSFFYEYYSLLLETPELAGIDGATAHTLRHTHASRLIQNGLNLYKTTRVIMHNDFGTETRYAHLEQAAVSLKVKEVMNKLNRAASQHGTDTTSGTL